MGGLAVFSLIGLYIFAGYRFVKSIRPGYRKWLAIAALALIPTADAVVGRIYLQHLCATEGGLTVNRVAQDVEGFMVPGGDSDNDYVKIYGYKFTESTPINGHVNRYSKINGKTVEEKKVSPKSMYRITSVLIGQKNFYSRSILAVETFPEKDVLATDLQIGFNGGWAERFLGGFADAGVGSVAWCDSEDVLVRKKEMIKSSLKR